MLLHQQIAACGIETHHETILLLDASYCTSKLPRAALKLDCTHDLANDIHLLHQQIAACGIETLPQAFEEAVAVIAPANCRVRH